MKTETLYQYFLESNGITTDTRNVTDNQLYFALKGDNFNGNLFAKNALELGAKLAIVDQAEVIDPANQNAYFLVDNVLTALQNLASYHRQQLNIPIISLTGSNGKTTTKELINAVLKQKFKTVATIGNLNNHIGVPLTLLSMDKNTEIGIVEMGANHQKEIEALCQIALPDYGYITNFGKAHLEGFGGVEGVIKGKSEMYDYLIANQKMAFVNLDDAIQIEKTKNLKRFTFAKDNNNADVIITNVEANPNVKITFNDKIVQSNLIGIYNAPNICAAITIGKYFEIEDNKITQAIENYIPTNNRSQILNLDTNQIIMDAYNANPSSMDVAIKNLSQLDVKNKVAVLGDMFELGEESDKEHINIITTGLSSTINSIYFVGERFYANQIENKKAKYFKTITDLKSGFSFKAYQDATILIKGSRGMALERLLDK
jgi:UDP-N-acetylmuramoyl-tripeptide--D-alanyl-D-alanine ligase